MKDIPNRPGYKATKTGQIQSKRFRRFLKQTQNKNGRFCVTLYVGGKQKLCKVHRLVLETYVGPCPAGAECRHLNGNPTDNRLENLCWGTHKQNMQDQNRHGTACVGEKNGRAKLTKKEVHLIRSQYGPRGNSYRKLAKVFNVSHALIGHIVKQRLWT